MLLLSFTESLQYRQYSSAPSSIVQALDKVAPTQAGDGLTLLLLMRRLIVVRV